MSIVAFALPNFYDGVPYLNTPPIEPGHTQKYEFPIRQSGTYWYHTHVARTKRRVWFNCYQAKKTNLDIIKIWF
jgi:FtsP/CotA-like multicopper oxidase with cupredoxin domain